MSTLEARDPGWAGCHGVNDNVRKRRGTRWKSRTEPYEIHIQIYGQAPMYLCRAHMHVSIHVEMILFDNGREGAREQA